jgi:hypothetical protein
MAKDALTIQAEEMLRENEQRRRTLFPTYNPLTGEGAPGRRRAFSLTDFMGGATLFLPLEMFSVGTIYRLARAGSVEAFCWDTYGEYSDDLRSTVVEEFLRLRSKYDFYFFAYAYARIKNKYGGEDIPFLLNPAQIKLTRVFESMRLKNKPIRVILLKARQWGGSTATQIYMSWIQVMWQKAWNSIIVGHQGDSAAEVKDMYVKFITQLPNFLFHELGEDYDDSLPKIKGGGTQNISLIPSRNCKIKTATAMNPEGARGGDSSMAHCTEVAFWPCTEKMDPQRQVKSSCSGIALRPLTMIVYESTANGQNFFKDEWDRANQVDEFGEKVSAFNPVFVAWWEIESYQEDPDDLLSFARTLISRRAEKTGHWDYLYWLWTIGATLQGICWYRNKMREYADLQDMQQEFPSNPVEAFLYSGRLVFDAYKVEKMRRFVREPKFRGDIYGMEPKGDNAMVNLHLSASPTGNLSIWEYPDEKNVYENRYFVSVDIGGRYDTSDYSVITVFDRSDMMAESGVLNEYSGPRVVAEWYGHTYPDLLAIKCAQISKYYADALLIVENNTAYSKLNNVDTDNVSELFFPILVPLYDNIYSKSQSETEKRQGKEHRYGFNTNVSTKVSIIRYMDQCIRDRLYIERNNECCREMSYYMKFPNGKYGAIPGKHDDRVMSRAIGLYVSRIEWDRYPVRLRKSREERMSILRGLNMHSSGAEVVLQH